MKVQPEAGVSPALYVKPRLPLLANAYASTIYISKCSAWIDVNWAFEVVIHISASIQTDMWKICLMDFFWLSTYAVIPENVIFA